jgi:hypothetical protein
MIPYFQWLNKMYKELFHESHSLLPLKQILLYFTMSKEQRVSPTNIKTLDIQETLTTW